MLNLRRAALGLSLAASLCLPLAVHAQAGLDTVLSGGCGTANYRAGQTTNGTQTTTGLKCTNAGSGGGPATLAAGSVAAGAYVSGSVLPGAFASGAIVDLTNVETTAGGSAPSKAISVQGIAGGTPLDIEALAGSNLINTLNSATPAGSNIIGKVGIDQTTPGTTNGVVNTPYITSGTPYTTAAMTGTTSTSLVPSPGGSLHNYISEISCVNSHATVGTFVTIQDGSGGTALKTLSAAAVFGGQDVNFNPPLRQPTAATALYVANVTTGANVICSAVAESGN